MSEHKNDGEDALSSVLEGVSIKFYKSTADQVFAAHHRTLEIF